MTENEMVGWHHRLDGHEFEQTPGADDGQGSLVCCSPLCHKELDTTERGTDLTSVLYSKTLLFIRSIHKRLHLLTPTSHSIPPPKSLLLDNHQSVLYVRDSRVF